MTGAATGAGSHVLVLAKSPVAGRVKTRLCPPCTPAEAAAVAEAALADTLDAVSRCGAARRIVALDGSPGPWLPAGFRVVPQVGVTFAERLGHAWAAAGGPGVQIGMDTPQVEGRELDGALASLDDADAAIGAAADGGWWAIAFRRPVGGAFAGVPMSTPLTGRLQRRRLERLGMRVADLGAQRDVDTFDDAVAVAAEIPGTRFAAAVAAMGAMARAGP